MLFIYPMYGSLNGLIGGILIGLIGAFIGCMIAVGTHSSKWLIVVGTLLGFLLLAPGWVVTILIYAFTSDPDTDPKEKKSSGVSEEIYYKAESMSDQEILELAAQLQDQFDETKEKIEKMKLKYAVLNKADVHERSNDENQNSGKYERLYDEYQNDDRFGNKSVNISVEAKKEYLESLKQKYEMGMISKEEYWEMVKRYR